MTDMAYVAVEDCGCVTAATVDRPEHAKYVAKDVGQWLKDGRSIERMSVEDARERLTFTCPHRDGRSWHEIAKEEKAAKRKAKAGEVAAVAQAALSPTETKGLPGGE